MTTKPIWVGQITSRKTANGKWCITVYSSSFGLLNEPKSKRHYIDGSLPEYNATCLAMHQSPGIKLYSNGCWLVSKAKEKYGSTEDRKDLFSSFLTSLRRKYDGINPTYESRDAQREIQSALNLPDMASFNFPSNLIKQ